MGKFFLQFLLSYDTIIVLHSTLVLGGVYGLLPAAGEKETGCVSADV